MSNSSRIGISVFLVSVAIALLAVLVLLATAEHEQAYRRADVALRHVRELALAIDREIDSATRGNGSNRAQLNEMRDAVSQTMGQIQTGVDRIYGTTGYLSAFRLHAMRWFNSIDRNAGSLSDAGSSRAAYVDLQVAAQVAMRELAGFVESQQRYVNAMASVREGSRELVSSLRERRRNEAADRVFQTAQSIQDRFERGGEADLEQIHAMVAATREGFRGMSLDDRRRLGDVLDSSQAAVDHQRDVRGFLGRIDIIGLERRAAALRERLAGDYLYRLSTSNDARVLLNVYTLLLLSILGFFGLRLKRSYAALNRSHDDLEERVSERTVDLENAYADLKESQVQLVQAEKMSSLGQLVAGVMHEINTPLLYVRNNASVTAQNVSDLKDFVHSALAILHAAGDPEVLRQKVEEYRQNADDAMVLEAIEEIVELTGDSLDGLDQISELVQSLKDFSRIDRADEELFDVRDGIEKTLLITKNILKHGVEVIKDLRDVPDIRCSASRVNQVFINIVTNAVHAMDGEGTLTISTSAGPDWVEVMFEDSGCGIPEENLLKIMDPFFTTKPVGQGTGLGMSIVKKIIDEHEGQILIDSKVDHGTRITLGFPLKRRRRGGEEGQAA